MSLREIVMLSRNTFIILCAFVLASCGGASLPSEAMKAGSHSFFMTCGASGEPFLVTEVGKNFNDAVTRYRLSAPDRWYCKSSSYKNLEKDSATKYRSVFYAEEDAKRSLIQAAREKAEAKKQARLAEERAAEMRRRRIVMEDACESYGFQKGTDQFPNCIKDLNIAMQNAQREERLAREMRQEVARQAGLDREKQQEVADQARWNAIFSTVVQAGVATANTNAQIRNNNMNTRSIITNQNMNTQRLIKGR